MIYGLYLSATGVLTNSYRQDVIANNLANSETVGFKKDLALFQERKTAAQEQGLSFAGHSNAILESLGGGTLAAPTTVDTAQGELEPSDSNLDTAIEGNGYFKVNDHGKTRLTRDGRFMLNREGELILSNGEGQQVLDPSGKPIVLHAPFSESQITVGRFGEITQNGSPAGRIGLFAVPDPRQLTKQGGTLLSHPEVDKLPPSAAVVRSKFIERANVEPATELAALMDTQRQLEANANMIRYQDQTLSRLVNDVGKIS